VVNMLSTSAPRPVRLGELSCRTIQRRWIIDPEERTMALALDESRAREIGDLLYVQDELSAQIVDYYDLHRPAELERRGAELADRLAATARVW
jgi:hypothetical protein